MLVFLLEIVLTASIYAYRERLTHGFDRGLNISLTNYGQDVIRTADFDVMQAKLACCGSRGYQDWDALNPPQPVPRSCCLQLANCDVENPDDIYNMVGLRMVMWRSSSSSILMFFAFFLRIGLLRKGRRLHRIEHVDYRRFRAGRHVLPDCRLSAGVLPGTQRQQGQIRADELMRGDSRNGSDILLT